MCIGWICIVGKIFIGLIFYQISVWYLLFSVIQMVITFTYFILCYQPQIRKIDYKEMYYKFKRKVMIKVLGEYAVNVIDREGKK